MLEDQKLAPSLGIAGVPIMVLRPAGARWEAAVALRGVVPFEAIASALAQVQADAAQ